jgi:hypothetical protein
MTPRPTSRILLIAVLVGVGYAVSGAGSMK